MLQSQQIEELICLVAALDRTALAEQFQSYQASFPVDFTQEFLSREPLERLQHIFVALCLQCQRLPDVTVPTAA